MLTKTIKYFNLIFSINILLFSQLTHSALFTIKGIDLKDEKPIEVIVPKKDSTTVVIFLSSVCPCSNAHIAHIKELVASYPKIEFIGVHSNQNETLGKTKEYFNALNLPFKVIHDSDATFADELKAYKTPHAFLLSSSGEILYSGGISSSAKARNADHYFLKDAIEDFTNNRAIKVKEGRPLGCVISRKK